MPVTSTVQGWKYTGSKVSGATGNNPGSVSIYKGHFRVWPVPKEEVATVTGKWGCFPKDG